jgi:molybdenum-dependent DNA-binding transcriptional regulator ModE
VKGKEGCQREMKGWFDKSALHAAGQKTLFIEELYRELTIVHRQAWEDINRMDALLDEQSEFVERYMTGRAAGTSCEFMGSAAFKALAFGLIPGGAALGVGSAALGITGKLVNLEAGRQDAEQTRKFNEKAQRYIKTHDQRSEKLRTLLQTWHENAEIMRNCFKQ